MKLTAASLVASVLAASAVVASPIPFAGDLVGEGCSGGECNYSGVSSSQSDPKWCFTNPATGEKDCTGVPESKRDCMGLSSRTGRERNANSGH